MTNNDILRRIRYTFDFNDSKMVELFGLVDHQISRAEVNGFLKREDEPTFQWLTDKMLALFLNGLIIEKRGKRVGVRKPRTERKKLQITQGRNSPFQSVGKGNFKRTRNKQGFQSRQRGDTRYRGGSVQRQGRGFRGRSGS